LIDVYGLFQTSLPQLADKYHLVPPGGCVPASLTKPCGYLTLPGVIETSQYALANQGALPDLDCAHPAPHCKAVPGSGLGMNYITPEFAAKVQALNNIVNQGINETARATHVPLVDATTIFAGIFSADPKNPYFQEATSINPGVCCALGYLFGGLLSFDGIHPSNTGHALVASAFIATINKAYGTSIPQVNVGDTYRGTRCHNKRYCFHDPYAPPYDGVP
jgi:hypothetical protein